MPTQVKYPDYFREFENVQALADAAAKEGRTQYGPSDSWAGGSREDAQKWAREGNTSAVPAAEEIVSRINAKIDTHGLRPQWTTSVTGAFPNVPAYLANSPETMFAMHNRNDRGSRTPVRVVYAPVCSASISVKNWEKRGAHVLALVIALSRVRPVDLTMITCYGHGDHVIHVPTRPMVMSEAAYVIAKTACYRRLSYDYADGHGWHGDWAPWIEHHVKTRGGR